jgi:hypothetical protein
MINKIIRWRLLLPCLAIALLGAITLSIITVNAQNQSASDLEVRLKQKGIPVRSVNTISRIPYLVEISLNSQSENNDLTPEDNWFTTMAAREATLAYQIGVKLNGYKLTVYNAKNEIISSSEAYFYPNDPSQNMTAKTLAYDSSKTREIVMSQLAFGDLKQDLVDVLADSTPGSTGQILNIQVSAADLSSANLAMPKFLNSLFQLLDTINTNQGAHIILCHLRVVDGKDSVLLDYVKDLEVGATHWKMADGFYDEWFPHPDKLIPTPTLVKSVPSVTGTPLSTSTPEIPAGSYPPPPTPTTHPYP